MTRKPDSAGVIVGRFQVSTLHSGHRFLIDLAREAHAQVVVVVGSTRSYPTKRNPLTFEMRRSMITKAYPGVVVVELADHPSDEEWSKSLDAVIDTAVHDRPVMLYGSRDSFLRVYSGRFDKTYIPSSISASGNAERARIAKRPGSSAAFRRGVIYAQTARPNALYQAVDTAVLRLERNEVLLGGKLIDGNKRRFIGGFVDPTDTSLESAAKREVIEETSHIGVDDFYYLGSISIDDWRYRATGDQIMTAFFCATYIFGAPRAADDLAVLEWVPLEKLSDVLIESHKPLGKMLLAKLGQNNAQPSAA